VIFISLLLNKIVLCCSRVYFLQNVPKRCEVFLVGTISSEDEVIREVSREAMEEFADVQNVQYFECQLDHHTNSVNEIFTTLVDNIVDSVLSGGQNFESESVVETSGI